MASCSTTPRPCCRSASLQVYDINYLAGTAITLICLSNLVRLALGQVDENELIDVQEEGVEEAHEIEKEMEAQEKGAKA